MAELKINEIRHLVGRNTLTLMYLNYSGVFINATQQQDHHALFPSRLVARVVRGY